MFGYFKSGASKSIEFLKSKSGVAVVLGSAIVIGGLYYYFRKKQDKPQGDSLPPKSPPKTKMDDSDDNASKWINQKQLTNVQKESDSTHREGHIELVIENPLCPSEPKLCNLELEAKEEQVTKDVSGILIDRIDRIDSNIENAQYINEDKSHVSIQRQTNEFESVVLDSSQSPEELDEESVIKYEIIKNIDDIIKEQWASIEQLRLMENIAVDNLKIKNINLKEVIKLIICQKIYNYSWKTLDLEWNNSINHKAININPGELQKNYWYTWKKDGRLEKLHKIFEGHPMYREIERLYKKQFELVLQQEEEAFDEDFNIKNMEGWQSPDIGISIPKAGSIISTKLGGKKYFGYNFLKGRASSFDSQAYEHAYFRYVKEHVISSSGSSSGGVYSDWAESYKTLTLEDKNMGKKDQLKQEFKWLDAFARLIIYMVERQEGGGDTKCVAIAHAGTDVGLIIGLNTGSAVNLVSQTVNWLMASAEEEIKQEFDRLSKGGKVTKQGISSSSSSTTWYNQKSDRDTNIQEFFSKKKAIANLPITYIMNGMQVNQETSANLEIVVKMHAEMSIIQYLLSTKYQFGEGLYIGNNKYACPGCHASMTLLNRDEAIKVAYRGHHSHFEGVAITVEDLIKELAQHGMQGLSVQIGGIATELNVMADLFQQSSIMESIIQSQALSMEQNFQQASIDIRNLASQIQQILILNQKLVYTQLPWLQQTIEQIMIRYIPQVQILNQEISGFEYMVEKFQEALQKVTYTNKSKKQKSPKDALSEEVIKITKDFIEKYAIAPSILSWWSEVRQQINQFKKNFLTTANVSTQLQNLYQQIIESIKTQALHQQIMGQAQMLCQNIIVEVQGLRQQVTEQAEVLRQQVTGQAQSLHEQITSQVQDILQQSSFNHKQAAVLLEAQRFFQQVSEGKKFEPHIAIHDSYQVIPCLWGKEQQLLEMINAQALNTIGQSQNPRPSTPLSPAGGFSDEEGYGTQKEFSVTPQSSLAFPPETSYYNTDTNSWYNDNHIHRLLNYYLPETQDYTVITPFIFNENNIHIYTAQAVQAAMTGQVVAMPINLSGNHWVGAVMWVEQESQTLRVIYNDPLGHGIQEDAHAIYFMEQLTAHTSTLNMQLDPSDTQVQQQTNYNDCGAFTTQNLIALAQAVQQNRSLNNEEAMQILQQVGEGTTIRQEHNNILQYLGQPEIPYPQQHQEYKGITEATGDISGMDTSSFDVNLYSLNTKEGSLYTEVLSLEGLVNKVQTDKKYLIVDSERENPGSQLKLSHILHQPNVEVKFTGIQYNCDSNTASCADNILLSQIVIMQEGYKTYVLQTKHHEYSHLSLAIEYTVGEESSLMQKVAQIENGEYQITDRGEEVWEYYKSGFVNSIHHVDKLIEKGNAVSQYAIKQKQLIAIVTENKNDKPKIEETNGNVEHSECKSYTLVSSNFSFLTPYALDEKLEAQAEFFGRTGIAFETLGSALDTGQISVIEIPSLLDNTQDNIKDENTTSFSDLLMNRFILNELDFNEYLINEKLRIQTEFFGRTGIIFETLQNAFNGDIQLNDNIIQGTMINIGALYSNFIHNLDNLAQAIFQTLQEAFDKDYQFNEDINQNVSMDTDWCNNPIFNIGSFEFEIPELNFFLCNGMIYWGSIS